MNQLSPRHVLHLTRRWWGMVRTQPLSTEELSWVKGHLLDGEFLLWTAMDWRDQRHALHVAQRFVALWPETSRPSVPRRDAVAAALLHDVGKAESQLSTLERVVVTIVGGRTERFRSYLEHESIGWRQCQQAGSTPITLDLLAGRGDPSVQELLQQADEI